MRARSWRTVAAVGGLLGLVGVVAVAAAGRAPGGGESRPSAHAPTLLADYLSTVALLMVPAGAVLFFFAAFMRRGYRADKGGRRAGGPRIARRDGARPRRRPRHHAPGVAARLAQPGRPDGEQAKPGKAEPGKEKKEPPAARAVPTSVPLGAVVRRRVADRRDRRRDGHLRGPEAPCARARHADRRSTLRRSRGDARRPARASAIPGRR